MTEVTKIDFQNETWKKFVKMHWKITIVMAAGIASAVVDAIFVFLWRITGPEAATLYPSTLGLWTVGSVWNLFWDIVLWEFLLVLLPVIAVVIVIFATWYRKLPADERNEYFPKPDPSKPRKKVSTRNGGRAINFIVTVTWLILIKVGGNWETAFVSWTFTYLITTILWAFLWDLIIIGTPASIALIWWLRRELRK
jgi:hypothetical protein